MGEGAGKLSKWPMNINEGRGLIRRTRLGKESIGQFESGFRETHYMKRTALFCEEHTWGRGKNTN